MIPKALADACTWTAKFPAHSKPFATERAVEGFCKDLGLIVGDMQRNDPRGLVLGYVTGNQRHGPLAVHLRPEVAP